MIALAMILTLQGAFEPEALLPGKPWVLKGHTDAVTAIAFAPDGRHLASVSRDKSLKLWDLKTGAEVRSISGAEGQLVSLSFSADGRRLAVGDVGLQVRVFDVESGEILKALAHPDAVAQVALSPDGQFLAVAGITDNGTLYALSTEKKKFTFRGRTARFVDGGAMLLISSGTGTFSLIDGKTGKIKKTVTTSPDLPLTTSSADGKVIASWTARGTDVKLWNGKGISLGILKGPSADADGNRAHVTSVAVTQNGKRAVVATSEGQVRLWSLESVPTVVHRWPAEKNSAVAISTDDKWVAVADSGLVKLWQMP